MVIGALLLYNEFHNDMFKRDQIRWIKNYSPLENPAFLVDTEGVLVGSNGAANELISKLDKNFEDIMPSLDESEKNRKSVLLAVHEKAKWFDVKKSIVNTQGTLTSYLLVDVSDEKHTSLMAELFFDAITDLVFIVTRTGELLFVNNEVKTRLGYDDDDINHMNVLDLHPEAYKKELQKLFEQVLENNERVCDLPLIAKDGETIPVETRIWLGSWNEEPVVFCMSKDISLYKEAEEKFRKSFYSNPTVMAISDTNTGEYLEVNNAFIQKMGYSKQELIGNSATALDLFADSNQRADAKKLLLRDGSFSNIEVDARAKNGKIIKGLFSGSYINTDNTTSLLTVMIDVTENHKRDSLLRVLTTITQDFLIARNYMRPISGALDVLGKALDVSRFFLIRCELTDKKTVKAIRPVAEWCADEVTRISDNPDFKMIPPEAINDYLRPVYDGQSYVSNVFSMPTGPIKEFYTSLGMKTVLTVPVFENETLWGVACLHECRNQRTWTELEKNTIKVFADSFAMAIQSGKSTEQVEFLSFHDSLTGLYNRRYYEQELLHLDNERYYPLTLVMADVNGLKLVNDAFGHHAGDLILQRFADALTNRCRTQDIVARIGGDEFVILLPNTNQRQAEAVIERINATIAKKPVDNLVLSASIGFSVKSGIPEHMNDVFKQAEDMMYRNKLSESSSIRSKTIDLILNSLFEKNDREMLHSHRVGSLCEKIAKAMKFSKDEINQMNIAGMMHDIGKIGISEETLNKPGGLVDPEWAEIKRHSEIGYRILGSVSEFSKIAEYVLEHHERPDGQGYPKGLSNDEISQQAKIIAIADAYDAMTSDRTYRTGMSVQDAVAEIKRCCGTQFDAEIAKIFVEKILDEKW
jgi:diguanylate cyclase (GGDEF)-like protein/PAS domain S-box-containing protein